MQNSPLPHRSSMQWRTFLSGAWSPFRRGKHGVKSYFALSPLLDFLGSGPGTDNSQVFCRGSVWRYLLSLRRSGQLPPYAVWNQSENMSGVSIHVGVMNVLLQAIVSRQFG